MEVLSGGLNGHGPGGPAAHAAHAANGESMLQHLSDLLEVTLGASPSDLESRGSLLSPASRTDTIQRCTRFASESQVALYVQKDLVGLEMINGDHPGSGTVTSS